jgi:hypothetical protein
VAVTTAVINVDMNKHFQDAKNRASFEQMLQAVGIETRRWWKASNGGWSIAVGTLWVGVNFNGSAISISDEQGDYNDPKYKAQVDAAYVMALRYAGQVAQADIINKLTGMGMPIQAIKQMPNGALDISFLIHEPTQAQQGALFSAQLPVRIQVALDGSIRVFTEDGTQEQGKKLLGLALGALKGIGVQGSGQFETHRHDDQQLQIKVQW